MNNGIEQVLRMLTISFDDDDNNNNNNPFKHIDTVRFDGAGGLD